MRNFRSISLLERNLLTISAIAVLVSGTDGASAQQTSSPEIHGKPEKYISAFNGPSNNSRTDAVACPGLEEVWRVPHYEYHTPLIKNGIVVYTSAWESSKLWHREVSAADLKTGRILWQMDVGPEYSPSVGCILGNRLFLPVSRQGHGGAVFVSQKVVCVDLRTGQHIWTWDTGISGTAWPLQAFPQSRIPTKLQPARVAFSLVDQGSQLHSIATLDPFAPTASTALVAQTSKEQFLSNYQPVAGNETDLCVHIHRTSPGSQPVSAEFRVYDRETLQLKWSFALSGASRDTRQNAWHSPPVVDENEAYVYDLNGILWCFDLARQALNWSVPVSNDDANIWPLVMKDVVLLASDLDQNVKAYNRSNGSLAWVWDPTVPSIGSRPKGFSWRSRMKGDVALIPLQNDEFWALKDRGSGSFDASGPIHKEPGLSDFAAAGDYHLFTNGSELICYRAPTDL